MRIAAACALGVLAVAACETGEATTGIVFLDPSSESLVGRWAGVEEIGGERGVAVRFPVTLSLGADRRFVLRTVGFEVSDGADARFCAGVFRLEGNLLEFFPDAACRALPIARFVVGRSFPDGLTLEGSTGRGGGNPEFRGVDVRVRIVVERDREDASG
ncbi:MAG TPA: hypothetical protein VF188_15230 [Longimicrobiales bacterium]